MTELASLLLFAADRDATARFYRFVVQEPDGRAAEVDDKGHCTHG